jgi:hypothetical protein
MKSFICTHIFHELLAATTDMAVLPGVLGCRPLRRNVQVRLGTNPAVPRDELPGGTPIFAVSRQQFMKYMGYRQEVWEKVPGLEDAHAAKGANPE